MAASTDISFPDGGDHHSLFVLINGLVVLYLGRMKKNETNPRGIARYEAIIQAANSGELWGLDLSRSKSTKVLISKFY